MNAATVHFIVKETCQAIWDVLTPTEMPVPSKDDWIRIESEFVRRWKFPNCIGALDGKHVTIVAPPNSHSLFYNYKGTFSINLMALVDANYKFIFIDVGNYGSNADGGVFTRSEFGRCFYNKDLDIPPPKALPNAPLAGLIPHCIVADEAFPLRSDIMRPYPRKTKKRDRLPVDKAIFNYRLTLARRVVENAFGILAQRFRLFNRRIQLDEKNVIIVVKACCVLHNWLRGKSEFSEVSSFLNPDKEPFLPAGGPVRNLAHLQGYHSAAESIKTRNLFKDYFNSPAGSVPFQDRCVREQ